MYANTNYGVQNEDIPLTTKLHQVKIGSTIHFPLLPQQIENTILSENC